MTRICFFDLLPVELLHSIFTYFFAHEILEIFTDLSNHVNACLSTYSSYRLNLQSIQLSNYHFICHRIRPEQIIYLKISDDHHTPGLSEHFFSQFHIEQFIHLRSLILSTIDMISLESIFSNLYKLDQLRSFSFNNNTTRYINREQKTNGVNEINRISFQIYNSYTLIIPQLNRLHLNTGEHLKNIQYPYLLYLKLEKCSMNELKTIFLHASSLKSLNICVKNEALISDFILTSTQFNRLHLTIDNNLTSMNAIEQFLSKLRHLKHFVVETPGQDDILNAQRWENVTKNLITFNFKFYIINSSNENLDSYRTSFWLKEKQWYVALNLNSIFSIPYFSPFEQTIPGRLFIDFTAPNDQIFYDQITKLTVVNISNENKNFHFNHIQILNIKYSILPELLLSIMHLHQVEQLSIPTLNDLELFQPLRTIMPKLYHLLIYQPITEAQMKRMRGYQFKQIQNLIIGLDSMNRDYLIEVLCQLFPCTKRLTYMTLVLLIDDIVRLIDGFHHLIHASFYSYCSFSTTRNTYCLDSKLYIRDTRIFTSRIYYSCDYASKFHINLWLKKLTGFSHTSWIIHRYLNRWKEQLDHILNTAIVSFVLNLIRFVYKDTVQYISKSIMNIGIVPYVFIFFFVGFCLFFISVKFTNHLSLIIKFCILTIISLFNLIHIGRVAIG